MFNDSILYVFKKLNTNKIIKKKVKYKNNK